MSDSQLENLLAHLRSFPTPKSAEDSLVTKEKRRKRRRS